MKKHLLLLSAMLVATLAGAQTLPMDKAVRYGKLDNGLTYYIRHNEEPKERGYFYIVQRVGAILEEDNQNGLAHFLEHIAFNGTKNFPGKAIINYMENIGAQFGTNLNAYTALDETVYMMRGIPCNRVGIVDSALLVLHDWSSFISLEDEEIDNERGVIREEWRTSFNAGRRLWKRGNAIKFPNSPYAKRDVIGDTAVINNFTYEELRAYYRKWYRPDLQAIIVVGDVDMAQVEASIHRLFADIPKPENAAERVYFPIADNEQPIVSILTDPEATTTPLVIEYKHKPLPDSLRLSVEGYNFSLINALIDGMLDSRFDKEKRVSSTPFVSGGAGYTDLTRTCDAFQCYVIAKEGRENEAFRRLVAAVERVKRYGFLQIELDRVKTSLLSSYEKGYNERNKHQSAAYTQEYVRHFLEAEAIPGIEWEYRHAQAFLDTLSLDVVNRQARSLITDTNILIDISAPEKPSVKLPTKAEVLEILEGAKWNHVAPYKEKELKAELLDKMPKAGSIAKESRNEAFGTTEWTLSNGVRVILKPTDFKDDEITLSAISAGGTSLLKAKDLPTAIYADDIIGNNGLGKFNNMQLNKLLVGKRANISQSISTYGEDVSATSSVKDAETMFKLVYLVFTAPRKDNKAFATYIDGLKQKLANANLDARKALSDTISTVLANGSERLVLFTPENVAKIDQNKAFKIYKERFANPADFTFIIVGSLNLDSIKPFILTYLGSLKTTDKREAWRDNGSRYPSGKLDKRFDREMPVAKTSIYLFQWAGGIPYNLENDVNFTALGDVLDIRYTESIREKEGGTYGVRVSCDLTHRPQEQATLTIRFDTNLEMSDRLVQLVQQELDSIAQNAPRTYDVDKVKKNLLTRYHENLRKNGWWFYAIKELDRRGINYVKDYETAVNNITPESIRQALRALLSNGNRVEVRMNPK